MLKLYHGEDVVCQEPEDIDPDRWLDKRELTELPESPLREAERGNIEQLADQRNPEPAIEIQIIPEDTEGMAVREGIHERIKAEIHQGNKEEEDARGFSRME